VALALGINIFLSNHNVIRADITSENLNSLAPQTADLIRKLRDDEDVKTVKIDAFVSPQVPAEYASHKRNLLSTLAELSSLSRGKIQVTVHEIENFSEQATLAEQRYGIAPREVFVTDRGARKREEVILGAAFASGLDSVVVPFIDKGIPIEYELVRSICTVAEQDRKKLGVLKTDVQLFGGLSMSMQGMADESRIIAELKKQYEVVEVDPAQPIRERFDVLLAVQPSSLSPEAMANFVDAVKAGQPTAVFEDPYPDPRITSGVPGTSQPKLAGGGMMGMFGGGQPMPKGDISQLWRLLGVQMFGDEIIWQDFNPEPKAGDFVEPEWIFVDQALAAAGTTHPFNPESPISSDLNQVLFIVAGSFRKDTGSKLKFTELAVTGRASGTITYRNYEANRRSGGMASMPRQMTREPFIVAAHVTGKVTVDDDLYPPNPADDQEAADEAAAAVPANAASAGAVDSGVQKEDDPLAGKEPTKADINVVLVADIDWIAPVIFALREIGDSEDMPIDWKFQNVTFVLNILDTLAGDDRFLEIRKRTRPHRVLEKIDQATDESRKKSLRDQQDFVEEAKDEIAAAQQRVRDMIAEVEKRTDLDPLAKQQRVRMIEDREQRALQVGITRMENDRNKKIKQSERELAAEIRSVQDRYKLLAVLIPPIPPILLAIAVFFHRRKAEQEGVDARRLRYGGSKSNAKQG
jgi:ABC-2 type transport system permease protein